MDMKNVKVINVMADGSICEDLSTYVGPEHPLPDLTKRLILEFIRSGQKMKQQGSGG